MGVATTVVNVTPTNFATIPPVASTLPGITTTLPSNAVGTETVYTVDAGEVIPKAVKLLYDKGFEVGLLPNQVEVEFARG